MSEFRDNRFQIALPHPPTAWQPQVGVLHTIELARVEMGAHQLSGTVQIVSQQDPEVEKTERRHLTIHQKIGKPLGCSPSGSLFDSRRLMCYSSSAYAAMPNMPWPPCTAKEAPISATKT
jgi:hypothetical protein